MTERIEAATEIADAAAAETRVRFRLIGREATAQEQGWLDACSRLVSDEIEREAEDARATLAKAMGARSVAVPC